MYNLGQNKLDSWSFYQVCKRINKVKVIKKKKGIVGMVNRGEDCKWKKLRRISSDDRTIGADPMR